MALLTAASLVACSPSAREPDQNATNALVITNLTPTPEQNAPYIASVTPALIDLAIYLPDETGTALVIAMVPAEDSPRGILSALVAAGVLPDVDYGQTITCTVADEELDYGDILYDGVYVHLDLPDTFAQAIRASDATAQKLTLQILADTFMTRYDADGLLLSIAGTDLETVSGRYDQPILLDQFVPVQVDTTAQP